jgi:hypothetical protein
LEERACYTGPDGTEDKGGCTSGNQSCGPDHIWGECLGQKLPQAERGNNEGDEDCDGEAPGVAQWGKSHGDGKNQHLHRSVVDGNGNLYIVGEFEGKLIIGDTLNAGEAAGRGGFVAKIDSTGKGLGAKANHFGAAQGRALGVALDGAGNVVVVGDREVAGKKVAFIQKWNAADGTSMWGPLDIGSADTTSVAVGVGPNDTSYVVGTFKGLLTANGGISLDSGTDVDVFVVQVDANGNLIKGMTFGSNGDDEVTDATVCDTGAVLVTGSYRGDVTVLDLPQTPPTADPLAGDIFVAKVGADAKVAWMRGFVSDPSYGSKGLAIVNDGSCNPFIAGTVLGGAVSFDSQPVSAGQGVNRVGFAAKLLDAQNGKVEWVKGFPGGGSVNATDIAVDSSGTVVVAGTFEKSVTLDANAKATFSSADLRDLFLVKFAPHDVYAWGATFADSGTDMSNGTIRVALNPKDGRILIAGDWNGSLTLGPNYLPIGGGMQDLFVASLTTGP